VTLDAQYTDFLQKVFLCDCHTPFSRFIAASTKILKEPIFIVTKDCSLAKTTKKIRFIE
jgi:hypothetical protein